MLSWEASQLLSCDAPWVLPLTAPDCIGSTMSAPLGSTSISLVLIPPDKIPINHKYNISWSFCVTFTTCVIPLVYPRWYEWTHLIKELFYQSDSPRRLHLLNSIIAPLYKRISDSRPYIFHFFVRGKGRTSGIESCGVAQRKRMILVLRFEWDHDLEIGSSLVWNKLK